MMKSLSRDIENMALHTQIHESIIKTQCEVKKLIHEDELMETIVSLVGDKVRSDDDLATTAEAVRRVNNMYKVQAEDRLEFFNRMHDELFPDGIQLHNE
jgi:hypothetical protein